MTRILNGYAIYGDSDYQNIMQMQIDLQQPIEKETMEQAFRAALDKASLINVRLVWKNNCLYFKKNSSIFSLSEEDEMILGEDNGGFLLSACVSEEKLTIATAHTLADGVLIFPFIRLVLMNYLQLLGVDNFEKQITNLGFKLSGEKTGEEQLREKLQEITINDQPEGERFRFWALEGDKEQECRVITLGLCTEKMSTSMITQVAETMKKHIDKVNADGLPISCGLIYDMRSILELTEPMHECYTFLSIPFENGEFEEKRRHLEAEGKMTETMARQVPVWQKLESEDMLPGAKRRLCNRMTKRQKQYQESFYLSSIAFTNKLDKLNNYIKCVSVCSATNPMGMLLEMNQLGKTMCLSISYIEAADKVVSAFIDEMRQLDILVFEKPVRPIRVGLTLPDSIQSQEL